MPTARAPLSRRDAPAEEVVLQGLGHLRVLVGQDVLAAHHERHLRPEGGEHVHELHAGDARADHHQVPGQGGRRVGLAGE